MIKASSVNFEPKTVQRLKFSDNFLSLLFPEVANHKLYGRLQARHQITDFFGHLSEQNNCVIHIRANPSSLANTCVVTKVLKSIEYLKNIWNNIKVFCFSISLNYFPLLKIHNQMENFIFFENAILIPDTFSFSSFKLSHETNFFIDYISIQKLRSIEGHCINSKSRLIANASNEWLN